MIDSRIVVRRQAFVVCLLLAATSVSFGGSKSEALAVALVGSDESCQGRSVTVLGTSGDDEIVGTNGNDVIASLGGNDTVSGLFGHDVICGGEGDDSLIGHLGSDSLSGDAGDDEMDGRGERDWLSGGSGADVLRGGDQDDSLSGGSGTNSLVGGDGFDLAIYVESALGVQVDLEMRISLGEGSDVLDSIEGAQGSPFPDTLTGDSGPNHLLGGTGPDELNGGEGRDVFDGGPGDDQIDGGPGSDLVSFSAARRAVSADLRGGAASGEGSDAWTSVENLEGSKHGDELVGGSGSNRIDGLLGADLIRGAGGMDFLQGGPGPDVLVGGEGRDWVIYLSSGRFVDASLRRGRARGDGRDQLEGIEVLSGSAFDGDRLDGDSGPNSLFGGPGRDLLRGFGSSDWLDGGVMRDILYAGPGQDTCETTGEDEISGCEEATHGDAPPEAVITSPRLGARVAAQSMLWIKGQIIRDRYAQADLAIVDRIDSGCRWWNGERFSRGSCFNARWLRTKGEGTWSYSIPVRRVDGALRLMARVVPQDRSGEESFELGRNVITLRTGR